MQAIKISLLLLLTLAYAGCSPEPEEAGGPLQIACTTGMVGDVVKRLVGDRAVVSTLMGPGVDPHLYKTTQGDLKLLMDADLIFYNGLNLEGKMIEVLEKMGPGRHRGKPVIALADSLPAAQLIRSSDFGDAHDPHVWFDVALWSEVVGIVGRNLARIDTANTEYYLQNAQAFQTELAQLHQEVKEAISSIPRERRVLITAHDAFSYFGRAYDIEVRGLQGISTASEYGLKDVSDLVSFITERGIKAVFVESSVSSKSLEAVVEGCARRGHQAQIGGTLYADAMGEAGSPEGTYPGMVRANVNAIVNALK